MVVTGRQLQWLLDSDAVDQRTRDRIAKSYGHELTAPDKLDKPLLMLWEDRYAIPQLLADKQCPHKPPPPHAMAFPLPHPEILDEMPVPAQDNNLTVGKQGVPDFTRTTFSPRPSGAEPAATGQAWEVAVMSNFLSSPEGSGMTEQQYAWTVARYRHNTQERAQAEALERTRQLQAWLNSPHLVDTADTTELTDWPSQDTSIPPRESNCFIPLRNDELAPLIRVPRCNSPEQERFDPKDQLMCHIFALLNTTLLSQTGLPRVKVLPASLYLNPGAHELLVASRFATGVTATTIDLFRLLVIPVRTIDVWDVLVIEPAESRITGYGHLIKPLVLLYEAAKAWLRSLGYDCAGWTVREGKGLRDGDDSGLVSCFNAALCCQKREAVQFVKSSRAMDEQVEDIREWLALTVKSGSFDKWLPRVERIS
ncbi:hypothetical protein CB0940_02189 [Cercospora beticola]|uniref:Uncharacterized protein n=1 Tax=Cercospora beticola TaxID=122368 RepID=A0A2G5I7M1_CERBT|nr:hypothetical protein CB0940_02189 [Cercospora beticola]PIB00722.1 hypothetical protein CB0940_02189 [Cercospora beticola]WPA97672.1 hypothetical protein RHO25_002283 [Cercospora beticola]